MSANNSFKPNLLRCTNNLADKACHVVGSATQVGLTQALGRAIMSDVIQHLLTSVKMEPKDSLWDGAPNAWVRNLGTVRSAQMAQDMVLMLTNGKPASTYASGYKVTADEHRIEIKLATLGRMGSAPAFMWQRIDMLGDFTDLCFIAIYPDDARLFVVPRPEIDIASLSKLKGLDGKYQLTTKRTHDLFPWMVRHEITGAP